MKPVTLVNALILGACLFSSGCLSHQVAQDGKGLRHAVLDMYTEQIMDNLVRAHSDMPFVQLTYGGLTVQDTDTLSGTASGGDSVEHGREIGVVGAFAQTVKRVATHNYSLSASGQREKQMSFTAEPVTDQNDIYEAYIEFAKNPALLMVSDKPPPGSVHIQKKTGDRYYWIPVEAGPNFLDLSMKTTFMRGPEAAPPAAYERTIADILELKPVGEGDAVNADLHFNEPVPNGAATAIVLLEDGRKVRLALRAFSKTPDGKDLKEGDPTIRLRAQWSPKQGGFTDVNLKQRPIRIYSAEYPPEASTPSPAFRPVVNELRKIRLNQSRNPLR